MGYKYLLLWLEGPLQSWGHSSKFGYRDTLNFPTKSGVYGLLLCSAGLGGEQVELLYKLAGCSSTIFSFSESRLNRLRDYHVVGNGYNKHDTWQELMVPHKKDGPIPNTGGSHLTSRYYLQSCKFAAIQEIPDDLCELFTESLQNPVWPLYLGRKTCVPSEPIYRGCFDSYCEAYNEMLSTQNERDLDIKFSVIEGSFDNAGTVVALQDVPISFGDNKRYSSRYVTIVYENGR